MLSGGKKLDTTYYVILLILYLKTNHTEVIEINYVWRGNGE